MRPALTLMLLLCSLPVLAVDLDGVTEFGQEFKLNSSISGRIDRVHVVTGQRVTAGELLLELDRGTLQAKADIAQARVESLQPEQEKKQTELDKAQELFDRDSLALVELDNAQRELRIAESRLKAAEAEMELAQLLLAQAELRSPIDGLVLSVGVFPGQFVNTRVSDPVLVTIVDNRSMFARAQIPIENWSAKLLQRTARVSYGGQKYSGKIAELGQRVTTGKNNHPALTLRIRFTADGKIPAGLPVQVSFDGS